MTLQPRLVKPINLVRRYRLMGNDECTVYLSRNGELEMAAGKKVLQFFEGAPQCTSYTVSFTWELKGITTVVGETTFWREDLYESDS